MMVQCLSDKSDLKSRSRGLLFFLFFLDKFEIFWYFSTYFFETTALLNFANLQFCPLAPFARFKGSLMRLE